MDPATKQTRNFNLTDGGVAANNPVMAAVNIVRKEIIMENKKFEGVNPNDVDRYLVISLGTGSAKQDGRYNAKDAAGWGIFSWVVHKEGAPLIDIMMQGSSDMADIHAATLFQPHSKESKYLRIQDDTLTGVEASVDVATNENLNALVQTGKNLLMKSVSMVNIETGVYTPIEGGGTNAEALNKYASILFPKKGKKDSEPRAENN